MPRALLRLPAVPLFAALALAACQTSAPGAAIETAAMSESDARVRIHGEAVYFEKVLLPDDARLRVQLIDSRLADTPRAMLAERVTTVGNGPYEFELDVPRHSLREDGAYGLQASVSMPDGALRFVTGTPVAVSIGADSTDVHIGRVRLHHVQPE